MIRGETAWLMCACRILWSKVEIQIGAGQGLGCFVGGQSTMPPPGCGPQRRLTGLGPKRALLGQTLGLAKTNLNATTGPTQQTPHRAPCLGSMGPQPVCPIPTKPFNFVFAAPSLGLRPPTHGATAQTNPPIWGQCSPFAIESEFCSWQALAAHPI